MEEGGVGEGLSLRLVGSREWRGLLEKMQSWVSCVEKIVINVMNVFDGTFSIS